MAGDGFAIRSVAESVVAIADEPLFAAQSSLLKVYSNIGCPQKAGGCALPANDSRAARFAKEGGSSADLDPS
jgi:hypothetical protein